MKRVIRFRAVDRQIFLDIKNRNKTVETRAGTVKYRNLDSGDTLVFVCGKERFEKKVKKARRARTPAALLRFYSFKKIRPDLKTKDEFIKSYDSFPGYKEKIKKFGLIAMELK
ncbi:MAG: hypothetical protein Q7S34_01035 [bacterium]|nr:hypothetical protein [bacterium]